jgi:hypothetical protein
MSGEGEEPAAPAIKRNADQPIELNGRQFTCVRVLLGKALVFAWRAAPPPRDDAHTAEWAAQTQTRRRRKSRLEMFMRNLLVATIHRVRARARGAGVHLSVDELMEKWDAQQGRCALTGVPMSHTYSLAVPDRYERNASLDRIDARGDYTPDNTQLVCAIVNRMKWQTDQGEFEWWCRQVARHAHGHRVRRADRDRFAVLRAVEQDTTMFQ